MGGLRGRGLPLSCVDDPIIGDLDVCEPDVAARAWCRSWDVVGSRYCEDEAVPVDGLAVPYVVVSGLRRTVSVEL